jgi:Xaa-Pro aminopeptidase
MNSLARVRKSMSETGIQALLVSDPTNLGWLTGFTGTYGRALVTPDQALFVTDGRYTIQANEEVKDMPSKSFAPPINGEDFLAEQVSELGIKNLAFDGQTTLYSTWTTWSEKLAGVELVPSPDLFATLRLEKSEAEIAKVRRSCALADACFEHVLRLIQPGVTELDIALDIEFYFRRQGAEIAFPSIVVSGERSARPHGKPSEKQLEIGDFVTMDFGAKLDGYCSDITRTVVVGEASARHKEVYELVLEAQIEALHAIRAGVPAKEVDRVAREILDTRDLAKYFTHGLGHGLGRVVHDTGRLSAASTDTIAAGQIWTIEPGVYIPGFGGVRIEDDIVITETGIEILTHSPKELLILPSAA